MADEVHVEDLGVGMDVTPDDSNLVSEVAAFYIIVTVALLGSFIEFLAWLLCYRTSAYQKLKSEIEVLSVKAKALEAAGGKDTEKKVKKMDEQLKKASGLMVGHNFKVLAVNVVCMFLAYRYIGSTYKGWVVAKLPFSPFKMVSKMSHANINGEDLSDCAGTFIYVLCQSAIRPNIQKFLGLGPSRALAKQTSLQSLGSKEL